MTHIFDDLILIVLVFFLLPQPVKQRRSAKHGVLRDHIHGMISPYTELISLPGLLHLIQPLKNRRFIDIHISAHLFIAILQKIFCQTDIFYGSFIIFLGNIGKADIIILKGIIKFDPVLLRKV